MAGTDALAQSGVLAQQRRLKGWNCPESAFRDSLDDGDFWNYVLLGILPGQERFDDGPYDDGPPEVAYIDPPCDVCGAVTACGYDEEGRPMIHSTMEGE